MKWGWVYCQVLCVSRIVCARFRRLASLLAKSRSPGSYAPSYAQLLRCHLHSSLLSAVTEGLLALLQPVIKTAKDNTRAHRLTV